MANMNADERFALISENLQEVLNPDVIKTILAEGRDPKVYWVGYSDRDVMWRSIGDILANLSRFAHRELPRLENLTADTLVCSDIIRYNCDKGSISDWYIFVQYRR